MLFQLRAQSFCKHRQLGIHIFAISTLEIEQQCYYRSATSANPNWYNPRITLNKNFFEVSVWEWGYDPTTAVHLHEFLRSKNGGYCHAPRGQRIQCRDIFIQIYKRPVRRNLTKELPFAASQQLIIWHLAEIP